MSTISILIENMATISGLTRSQKSLIKTSLTLTNPLFNKHSNMGLATWSIPKALIYYKDVGKESISIPVGALPDITKLLINFGLSKKDIIDKRISNPKPDYFNKIETNKNIKLRSYQDKMVSKCLEKTIGTIEAMTGSGKTLAFIDLILKRQEPTMILVNTIELANQTISSITKYTNLKKEDIGFVGSGKFNLKPITIALLQTVTKLSNNKINLLNNLFGQIISDEVL
jgi:hypothetical protein|tara:strand:+ start:34 stop:717 length:684 start_codon:yes stop_codon:yes gene_type:complete